MMVDSSIVVLENVFRRRDDLGEEPAVAAVAGAAAVGPAIVASTLTTLVIFLPLVFVRGISGILFQELAYVIVFSLVCSLLVWLSLVPLLAARLLRPASHVPAHRPRSVERLVAASGDAFRALDERYRALLVRVLVHRWRTVGISAGALAASLLLVPLIGTEFMPPSDEGEVRISGQMEVGTRLGLVDEQMRKIEEIVMAAVPEVAASVTSVGASGWNPGSASEGELHLTLVPARERDRSNAEIADDLRRRLDGQIAGMTVRVRAPQGQFLLERVVGGEEDLVVEVRGFDLETLDALAQKVAAAIVEVPGITDVESSRTPGVPQQIFRIDRDKASDLGLTARQVSSALETALAGSRAGEYRASGDSYRILVQLRDVEQVSMDEILDMTLSTAGGEDVALRNVVATSAGRGPIVIDRKDQQRLASVTANVAGRDTGSVAAEVQERLAAIPRPMGYDLLVAGDYEEQREAFAELLVSLALALALVYMVLAAQYESLRDPLIVMFSVPLASIGVLLALFLTGTTLNVQSYIGCIMLVGIVVNNAILLVDQAGRLREGAEFATREAVAEAGRRRLRPILMTTLTTILGLTPLAFGIGEGADAQAPLARAVVGGLTASTLVTLVLIPAVYSLFHGDRTARP